MSISRLRGAREAGPAGWSGWAGPEAAGRVSGRAGGPQVSRTSDVRNRDKLRYTRTHVRPASRQRRFKPMSIWSAGRDLNPRLYGFAGRSLGPLGHRRREPQRTGGKLRGGPGASSPAAADAACAGRPRLLSETPRSEASGAGGHGCCHRGRARVAQAGHHRSHRRASQDHIVDHHDVASSRRLASPVAG